MSAPINEFVRAYSQSGTVRFHMPGHKGRAFHGLEALDITEISGADYLYDARGIIGQSEAQTAQAFGSAATLYSTEGSSQCIKTMLGIVRQNCRSERMTVLAPRNVHKAFIDACILLDLDIKWLYPLQPTTSVCCADITPEQFEQALSQGGIDCCYVTSPDYLGNSADIGSIARICKAAGIPLLVDNAHGAYTAFLKQNVHPVALGADMCCDSAHKTLPCYTGGAYLHISKGAPEAFVKCAKSVMSMFGSTSPSYLILQSLDLCSEMLRSGEFSKALETTADMVESCKQSLLAHGWVLCGNEKMKMTVHASRCGYTGTQLADMLRAGGIEPEYSDTEYVVLMAGISNTQADFDTLTQTMGRIPVKAPLKTDLPIIKPTRRVLSARQAALQPSYTADLEKSLDKVCALTVASCQPSVPVVVSGEVISEDIIKILKRYSIFSLNVLYL